VSWTLRVSSEPFSRPRPGFWLRADGAALLEAGGLGGAGAIGVLAGAAGAVWPCDREVCADGDQPICQENGGNSARIALMINRRSE
jgi:hypothetical protein